MIKYLLLRFPMFFVYMSITLFQSILIWILGIRGYKFDERRREFEEHCTLCDKWHPRNNWPHKK